MFSELDLAALAQPITDIQNNINTFVLNTIAKRVKEIGELSATDLMRLERLFRSGKDANKINREIAQLTKKSEDEIRLLIRTCAQECYDDARPFYEAQGKYIPIEQNAAIQAEIDAIAARTILSYRNIANTTAYFMRDPINPRALIATSPSDTYTKIIDEAILFARRGITDYQTSIRTAMRQVIDSGLCVQSHGINKIQYASGNRRRLDTAVRMNVLEGIHQINQGVQNIIGDQIGADGKEISVHFAPAPDHEQCQGHMFTLEAYDKINHGEDAEDVNGVLIKGFTREIGTLNCRHFAMSVVIGVSEPIYAPEDLEEFIIRNHEGIKYNGKYYTMYEATQLQRNLETKIRRTKDGINAARASGDKVLVGHYSEKYYKYRAQYTRLSKAAGLSEKKERIAVSGFRRPPSEATIASVKENARKRLTKVHGNDKINAGLLPIESSSEYAVHKGLLESRDFREKFNRMTDDTALQREFYQQAKIILEHRSGTNGEDLALYNITENKWYLSTDGKYAAQTAYTQEQIQMLTRSKHENVLSFHNHPLGMPPSIADLNSAYFHRYTKSYTIGHNGRIYEYTAPVRKIEINEAMHIKKYEEMGYSSHDAQLKVLEYLMEIYKFTVKEL